MVDVAFGATAMASIFAILEPSGSRRPSPS